MTHLKKGDSIPSFSVTDQNGNLVTEKDYVDKKLVIYFYPKDMTPGCTSQACNIRDNYALLQQEGISILGVSADDVTRHQKFIDKYDLPFPLLADTELTMIKNFGIWGEKKFMGKVYDGIHRTTFLINESGKVHEIITKPKTKEHAEEILELFK